MRSESNDLVPVTPLGAEVLPLEGDAVVVKRDQAAVAGAEMLWVVNGGAKRDHRGGVKWDHLAAAALNRMP